MQIKEKISRNGGGVYIASYMWFLMETDDKQRTRGPIDVVSYVSDNTGSAQSSEHVWESSQRDFLNDQAGKHSLRKQNFSGKI